MSNDALLWIDSVIIIVLCIEVVRHRRFRRRASQERNTIHESFWPFSVWSPQDASSWGRGAGIFAHDTLDADAAMESLQRDRRDFQEAWSRQQAETKRERRQQRWRWLPWSRWRRRTLNHLRYENVRLERDAKRQRTRAVAYKHAIQQGRKLSTPPDDDLE